MLQTKAVENASIAEKESEIEHIKTIFLATLLQNS